METVKPNELITETNINNNYNFLTFMDLFEVRVKTFSDSIAVVYRNNKLTYNELDKLSTNLAKLLKAKGVKKGDVVALGVYNSLDVLIGMIGIFKAGGVYLPIDPHYPNKRISQMFSDAEPFAIITELSLEERFLKWNKSLLLIDMLPDFEPDIGLERVCPEETAYIVYTSGSTGVPKGIHVSHLSLTHSVIAYQNLHPKKYSSILTGSISFDPSLLITTYTLSLGGSVFIPQNNDGIDPKSPEEYMNVINRHSVEYLLCTPSLYTKMLKTPENIQSLKCVDLCGENVPKSLLNRHSVVMKDSDLFNVYGPSEYAMGVTAAKLYDAKVKKTKEITIGRPFFNNKVYILDEHFQPVSIGEKGEIFIGGAGLAKGYLNKDQLTKEKFLFLELDEREKVRLYKTGDMGKYLKNGEIKFLGREDQQIKVLGHRIELSEIEQAICSYPKVCEAVAFLTKGSLTNRKLIACVNLSSREVDGADIIDYLSSTLPSYMIPYKIQIIEKWPYNDNGKIDRKKLALGF